MQFYRLALLSAAVTLMAGTAFSAVNVLEGFETDDAMNWQATSPVNQTVNATNPLAAVTPTFGTSHVTQGTQSGEFLATWTLPGAAATANPHVSGGPLQYWSIRYNANSPGGNPGNSLTAASHIQADFYNNNAYPIQVALVLDSSASSQLERGPFVTLAANATTVYDWDLATVPATGWVNGDGVLVFPARLKTMVLYTDVAPTSTASSVFVDNIRDINAQTDTVAPAAPVIYSAKQGAAVGDLVVKWKASTEPDLAGYRVYVASQTDFNAPTTNRLTFPTTPAGSVLAGTNTFTLTGQPTGAIVYVKVSAYDNATPSANESESGIALGVNLKVDGAQPTDRVVLDLDRNAPGTSAFTADGYFHSIVYNGEALHAQGRSFDSVSAAAIDASVETLAPSVTGIVLWENMIDGTAVTSLALSNPSVAALTTFVGAGGDLVMSGAGTAEDLSTRTPETQAFLANVLKASLINANVAVGEVTLNTAPLPSAGTFSTNKNVFADLVGFSTTSNEQLDVVGGSTGVGAYTGIGTGFPAIVNSNSVVFLGFGLESVGGADATASRAARQAIINDSVNYLKSSKVADWQLY